MQSLFTNIPLDETINICADLFFHEKKKVKGMLNRHFKQLLTLSGNSSCLLFVDVYYHHLKHLYTTIQKGKDDSKI